MYVVRILINRNSNPSDAKNLVARSLRRSQHRGLLSPTRTRYATTLGTTVGCEPHKRPSSAYTVDGLSHPCSIDNSMSQIAWEWSP